MHKALASLDDNHRILRILIVALGYLATAQLCINLPTREGPLTPVWIPSGVALAALICWGRSMAVGVFIGDVATSLITGLTPLVAVGVAAGDTVECLIGLLIINRLGRTRSFQSTHCALALIIAAPVSALVSATIGIGILEGFDQLERTPWRAWFRYWMSAMTGMLLVTPFLISWFRDRRPRMTARRIIEGAFGTALLIMVSWSVFVIQPWQPLEPVLLFPLLAWSAVRFGLRGATAACVIVAAIAQWGAIHRLVVLQGFDAATTVDLLQLILVMIAVTMLLVAASLTERTHARKRVEQMMGIINHSQKASKSGSWEYAFDGSDRVWCSEGLLKILPVHAVVDEDGYAPLGKIVAAIPAEARTDFDNAVRTAALTREPFEIEHHIQAPGKTDRVLHHWCEFIPAQEDEGLDRLIGATLDVTEVRELDEFKDSLIVTASHELRTPLTSIMGFADTLLDRWDQVSEEGRKQYVGIIDEQAHRLTHIVEDTLLQSHVDTGTLETAREPFPVQAAIESALIETQLADDVRVEIEDNLVAIGDHQYAVRALTNLLTNARKYGSAPFEIKAGSSEWGVEVCVEDHGPGIAQGYEEAVFDRFSRGPGTSVIPGTGLGLSVAQGLMENVGGTLHYEREDRITRFVITWPGLHMPAKDKNEGSSAGSLAERSRSTRLSP